MTTKTRKPDTKSRRAVIDHLKLEGPQDAEALAANIGVSAMAVRQHLYTLEGERLVTYEEEPRPLGRPAKLWRLTPAADKFFPDGHQDLTLGLLAAMREAFGPQGLEKLLELRSAEQTDLYRKRVPEGGGLGERLEALAALRSEEGYMAEVQTAGPDTFLLVENHCPICSAAKVCQGLCAAELSVFQAVLGDGVEIERSDHILAGARRCAYRVRSIKARTASRPAPADPEADSAQTKGFS
jgi:predicted ArsR family transcriptional regulator